MAESKFEKVGRFSVNFQVHCHFPCTVLVISNSICSSRELFSYGELERESYAEAFLEPESSSTASMPHFAPQLRPNFWRRLTPRTKATFMY